MRRSTAEVALSLGVLALGAGAAVVAALLPAEGGYSGIGPNFFPALVAGGLVALGAWLLYEARAGGWRRMPHESARFERHGFGWVSAGLLLHMALIGWAGFIIAATVLFTFVARGFGSRRFLRDLAVGVALALAVYLFFAQILNVSLPAVWTPFRP